MADKVTPTDKFAQQLETFHTTITQLLEAPDTTLEEAKGLISSLTEETQVALEELRVADEELQQQNEALQQAREVLEAERQHYSDLFEKAPVGFVITNAEGVIQEANRAATELLNISPQHITGKPLPLFFQEQDRRQLRRKLFEFRSGKEKDTWEARVQPRGVEAVHDIAVTAARMRNWHENGSLRWLLYDITERKRAEAEDREHYFRATFEQAAVGIAHVGIDGRWLRINQKLCDILVYPREELIALTVMDVTYAEDRALTETIHEQLANGEVDSISLEKRFLRKDGAIIWADLTISAVRDAAGELLYSIGVMDDITPRKRIEAAEREQRNLAEALRASAITLTSTLNLSEVLDHILNSLGRIVAHEAASILLIQDGNPLVTRSWRGYDEHVVPSFGDVLREVAIAPATDNILAYVAATKQPFVVSDWNNHGQWDSDPKIQAIRSFICAPIVARDEVIGFIELHSSTPNFFSHKQSEHLRAFAAQAAVAIQNAKAHEQAQTLAALEERNRLARDLHDAVTQSLFTASIVAESLLRLGKKHPDKIWPNLEKLHTLTRGALAEMRSLLLELRPDYWTKMSLSDQLQQLADAVKSRKRIDIQMKILDGKPLRQDVQIAFYRIAQEALNNVVKHSRANRVEIILDHQTERVRLQIRDNGRGFNPEAVTEGFGMESLRERARAIHAALEISSEPGRGTEVTVSWPQR